MASIFENINEKITGKKTPEQNLEKAASVETASSKPADSGFNMFSKSTDDTESSGTGNATTTSLVESQDNESVTTAVAAASSLSDLGQRPVSSVQDSTGKIKPDFGPATKTTGNNNMLKDVELPETPAPDASPSDITKYYLDKLNAVTGHLTAGRNVLAELHTHLKDNPDTKELLLPENLGEITRVMGGLTARAHSSAQVRKKTSQARVEKKEVKVEKVNAEVEALGDIF